METICTKDNAEKISAIREALLKDGIVKLTHDPFIYGFHPDMSWLLGGLKDTPCNIFTISLAPCGWTRPNTLIVELIKTNGL